MKENICKHCGAVSQHFSFQCYKKPSKQRSQSSSFNKKVKQKKESVLARRKIAPVSEKQKARLAQYHKLRLEYLNSHSKCEAKLEGCTGSSTELHHKASRDGNNLFKYFCAVCRNCHRFIHDRLSLEDGINLGLLIRKTTL